MGPMGFLVPRARILPYMATPLSQKIASCILESGAPMTFVRFMEMALYDSDQGYYVTGGNRSGLGSHASPIGMQGGDFFTVPCVSPFLAQCIVSQVQEIDELLGRPSEFTILEMGPGGGRFIKDLLDEIARCDSDFYSRLSVILVEQSPYLRTLQEQALANLYEQTEVTWISDLKSLKDASVIGVFLSNELVDAFPVHRVRMQKDGLKEIYVDHVAGDFVELLDDPSTDELAQFLKALDVELPVGFTTEINLNALDWMQQVARVLYRGVVLTIDYGHTSQDYFSPERKDGTLLCYYRHSVKTNPYERIGEQDMTAHVNFSSLAKTGEQVGLELTGFTNLTHFLMSLGIDEMVVDFDQESDKVRAAIELLRPHGMGTVFKVLIQHKGLDLPMLQALRHRPFFEHVLTPAGCGT